MSSRCCCPPHSAETTYIPNKTSLGTASPKPKSKSRRYKFQFQKHLKFQESTYQRITGKSYLVGKYGESRAGIILSFIRCIHRKINADVGRVDDSRVLHDLSKWEKSKLFLLLVMLSQRGGPEYWVDKSTSHVRNTAETYLSKKETTTAAQPVKTKRKLICTLVEQIMRENITADYVEEMHDENYVFSSILANFMEGLINHYLEKVIIPKSELKVCQQLYKPMMKIISLYNEYNELMEKSERNGFLSNSAYNGEVEDCNTDERIDAQFQDKDNTDEKLGKAQKLLWQARHDIPNTISKELTLLSEMYSTLSADEQDYQLDEFVCCAEEYIEMEYLPAFIELLFKNCGTIIFWKIMLVLEPFFYYIEEVNVNDNDENDEAEEVTDPHEEIAQAETTKSVKPDPRVVTLEKICEVAARQKWI